jgi:dihydropyrimidinase
VRIYAETCPHYLFLSEELYELPGFEGAKYVCCPPLRSASHQEALWRGLANGDLQVVSTDHCPWCFREGFQGLPKQKELGIGDFSKIPPGLPGVETRMQLLFDGGVRAGRIDLRRWVELTATAPARIFGLYPRKGTIAVGSDADLVIWDPERQWTISAVTHHMRVDYNPYEGRSGRGLPDVVMSRGEIIVSDGKCLGEPGRGSFLRRTAEPDRPSDGAI